MPDVLKILIALPFSYPIVWVLYFFLAFIAYILVVGWWQSRRG